MPEYRVNGQIVSDNDPTFESMLESVYKSANRPLCLCLEPGVEMQIAKIYDHYYIKRMPKKGQEHSPDCGSFETPAELSGRGDVLGTAIQEEDGVTTLKFDFALSHKVEKPDAKASVEPENESVKSPSKRLSLRGILHYLWEEAGLNRWHPTILQRPWSEAQKQLTVAASGKKANDTFISEYLYIPEMFVEADKPAIIARRMNTLLAYHAKNPKKLMMLIGEVKEGSFNKTSWGGTLLVEHVRDFQFLMEKKLFDNIESRFAMELALFRSNNGNRLVMGATFSLSNRGTATIEQITLMATTDQWIPFETMYERNLIMYLIENKRSFEKALRYNVSRDIVMPDFILLDTKPLTTNMFLIPETKRTVQYKAGVDEIIVAGELRTWVWDTAAGESMPMIPESVLGQTAFAKYGIRAVM